MKLIENRLRFTGKAQATVYFNTEALSHTAFAATAPLSFILFDAFGNEISRGCVDRADLYFECEGNYRLILLQFDGDAVSVALYCDDGVLPYIMPGVGVLWEHGAVFPLLLERGQVHTVWCVSSEADTTQPTAVIKGIDFGEDTAITADGKPFNADWYPKMERPWFWHSARLPHADVTRIDIPETKSDVRVTVYNRTVVALAEPVQKLALGTLALTVSDKDGKEIDARVEVFVGDERVALRDRLVGENEPIYLPHGRYRVKASHGMMWSTAETFVDVTDIAALCSLTLEETVKLSDGWLLGELHTHSSLEDATLFPSEVMRAARACGRSFCFMTDKDVGLLDSFGLHSCDKDGVFAAFPGQEIMCHELHTNVLHPSHRIDNPEAEDLGAVNPDIEEKIVGWLSQYREMKKDRPCLIMHNHPEHRPEVMKRGKPYFRSWWVSDMFREDYHLVENCGFEGWFDRLNRGLRIYAAWTGDGHDCTLMYPGKEGVCVYTGGKLTAEAVIDALETGKFFSCREPGVFVDIAFTDARRIKAIAAAPIEIDTLEVIADGQIIAKIDGNGKCAVEATCEISENTQWCMARVKLCGGDWNAEMHSFTPFMASGYAAFTNPIFCSDNI